MTTENFDPDLYTKMGCLTSQYHRDVYPALASAQASAAGKYVLVTGASQGLGRAMALSWAKAGAAGVAICARTAERLTPVVEALKAANPSTTVIAQACDTTKPSDVVNLFDVAKVQFGKLDVVIANVGQAGSGKIAELDEEKWWSDIEVNVRSAHLVAHNYIRAFGPEPDGTFITLTSGIVSFVMPGLSSYGMAKRACITLVEYLDAEFPKLKAFSMDPGIVKGVAAMPEFVPFALDTTELVGAFSIWLASGRADMVKGGYVHVTWDVEELEKHGKEIQEKNLLKTKFLGGILGQEGGALGR